MEITKFTKPESDGPLSKTITLGPDGKPVSNAADCYMWRGDGQPIKLTFPELVDIIGGCSTQDAITLGSIRSDLKPQNGGAAPVVVDRKLKNAPKGSIARTRDRMEFRPGADAAMLLDYDRKGMFDDVRDKIDADGGFWSAILSVCPGLKDAERIERPSTSSGLHLNGRAFPASGGLHVYIHVEDATDIPRATQALHDRCALMGYGWAVVSRSGLILHRSLVDPFVGMANRLVFEGPPQVLPPLQQDTSSREPRFIDGVRLDTRTVIPDFTAAEMGTLRSLWDTLEANLATEAAAVKQRHVSRLPNNKRNRGPREPRALRFEETAIADFSSTGRDLQVIKAALNAHAAELAIALLGEPTAKHGADWRWRSRESLSVIVTGPKAGVFFDHESGDGGDLLKLIMCERACGFRETLDFARNFVGLSDVPRPSPPRPARQPSDEERRDQARRLWSQRQPIEGSHAEKYLRQARGYHGPLASTLGYLPARGPYEHALIVPFGVPDEPEPGRLRIAGDAVRGVHLIKLNADGSDRIRDHNGKITVGPCLGSPLVVAPFAEGSNALTIGEGVEKTLAIHAISDIAAWAAGGASRLPALADAVPAYVDCITVIADADDAGRRHAATLAQRLQERGFEVRLLPGFGTAEAAP